MRKLFTTDEFYATGGTRAKLRWGVRTGTWVAVARGVFADRSDRPDALTQGRARVLASNSMAWGALAGALHDLDNVTCPDGPPARRRSKLIGGEPVVLGGVRCTNLLQTVIDLAEVLDDIVWEQALESAARRDRSVLADLDALLPILERDRRRGVRRIRRVLALRPIGAPPTESLLETLMVQLIRTVPDLPTPVRQYEVYDDCGGFVARVDLCWPALGLFIELDGRHHRKQGVYDARRETAVVAATGWLCGRFTWREVHDQPLSTARRLVALVAQARKRPVVQSLGTERS